MKDLSNYHFLALLEEADLPLCGADDAEAALLFVAAAPAVFLSELEGDLVDFSLLTVGFLPRFFAGASTGSSSFSFAFLEVEAFLPFLTGVFLLDVDTSSEPFPPAEADDEADSSFLIPSQIRSNRSSFETRPSPFFFE